MDIKLPQLCTIKADCVSVAAEECGDGTVTLLLMTPDYTIAIEGTPMQVAALTARAHGALRVLPKRGCADCGVEIADADTADKTTDGRALLCPDCANPAAVMDVDEDVPACTECPAGKGNRCEHWCPTNWSSNRHDQAAAAQA